LNPRRPTPAGLKPAPFDLARAPPRRQAQYMCLTVRVISFYITYMHWLAMMRHERDDVVIDVKRAELKLIATTDIDLEYEACEDIENALAFVASNIYCVPLERRGLVLVYANRDLDSLRLAKTLTQSNVRCFWIYPVHKTCKASYEDISKCTFELISLANTSKPIKLLGKCRKRGMHIDSCTKLLKHVMPQLESLNLIVVDFRNPEYILRIEIVNEIAALSLYPAIYENIFKVKRGCNE